LPDRRHPVNNAGIGTIGRVVDAPVEKEMAFPKFMWMPSRAVAKAGVDALADDRGSVIPGLPGRILLPLFAKQHPALRH
jgi:short-subunit dehydrogenase